MPLLNTTNIPKRLTSFTAECLAVRDNCVASKQDRPSGPAGFICRGMYPMTDEAGRAFFVSSRQWTMEN